MCVAEVSTLLCEKRWENLLSDHFFDRGAHLDRFQLECSSGQRRTSAERSSTWKKKHNGTHRWVRVHEPSGLNLGAIRVEMVVLQQLLVDVRRQRRVVDAMLLCKPTPWIWQLASTRSFRLLQLGESKYTHRAEISPRLHVLFIGIIHDVTQSHLQQTIHTATRHHDHLLKCMQSFAHS